MKQKVSANIKQRLIELGLTREQWMERDQITPEELDPIDKGEKPSAEVLNKIATALGTNGIWLIINGLSEDDVEDDNGKTFKLALLPIINYLVEESKNHVNPDLDYTSPITKKL